jgi:hypothetical protein
MDNAVLKDLLRLGRPAARFAVVKQVITDTAILSGGPAG